MDIDFKEIQRKQEKKDKMSAVVRKLTDILNVMGAEEEATENFFKCVITTHPTLQANLIRMLKGFLKFYGELEYFDLRNKGAVEYAKEVSKVEGYIPFI